VDAAKTLKLPYSDKLQKGLSDYQADKVKHIALYDNSKGKRILGIRYHTLEETVADSLEDFQKKGWIN
jgi:nucleoside-diphosphate-sugar epimerase